MRVNASLALSASRYSLVLLCVILGIAGCGRESATTTIPSQEVATSQGSSSVTLTQTPAEQTSSTAPRVSAIFRNNPNVVDFADVTLAFVLSRTPVEDRNDRDLAFAASQLLPGVISTFDSFSGLNTENSNFVPDQSLKTANPSQPDLLDVAVLYAATVIPEDQRTEAVLAEVVNSLVPGQGLTANDIAAIPPNLPSTSSNEDPGETPGTARVLGPLPPGVLTITGAVGRDDPSDFYRFEIEQISDIEIALTNLSNDGRLQLIQDLNDDGEFGLGELIFESNASGTLNENISSALDPGTYFIQVLPGNVDATTEVGYTLTTNVSVPSNNINPEPGNTLVSATELDEFNTDFRGFVSTLSDADDFYRFELTQITDIEITLRGLSGDARLELIQDLNNNGELDLNELVFASDASGTLNEDIESALDSGTYFVRVLPGDDDATGVGYTLRVNASLPSNRIDPEPGNTLVDATELDGFNTDFRGFVSTLSDADDFYRFELAQITDIEITLRNLSGDGRLELIQDLNDNGNLDLNELIFASDASGTLNEDIESVLDPGTYFIRILPGDDDATGVGYTLRVNASLPGNRIDPEPGNTLVDATELDEFNTEFRGFVSTLSDSDDFYRFELEQITGIEITLRDLSGDGRLELIQDSNNNGDFDFNELLFESNSSGTLSEDIETTLDPGTYFIRVLPGSESATGVGYTLRANA